MPPQNFLQFLLHRVWCTTVFFVALLVAVFTATSVYYVVRINMIEKHLNARSLKVGQKIKADAAGDDAITNPSDGPVAYREIAEHYMHHQFMSRATPPGHSELVGRLRRSTTTAYEDGYRVLSVNTPMSRQAVRNPTLPESIPLWEREENPKNQDKTAARGASRVRVPARQRYVLDGLEAGKQYMLRLSFLGSPSVTFEMFLYQVPQSQLTAGWDDDDVDGGGGAARVHGGWSAVPQDTELRVFATSPTNALQFDPEEEVWVDELPDGDVEGGEGEGEGETAMRVARAGGDDGLGGPYVPVVEVRPRALSIPIDPARLPVVRYNIVLEPLSASFLPQVALPLITYSACVVVFVGYLFVYTFVSTGIAGGRPHAD